MLKAILSAPLLLGAVSALTMPPNAKQGLGFHFQHESGEVSYVHHEDLDEFLVTRSVNWTYSDEPPPGVSYAHLEARYSDSSNGVPKCEPNTNTITPENLRAAIQGMVGWVGCGQYGLSQDTSQKYYNVAATYYWEDALVYYCDYGGKQNVDPMQVIYDLNAVHDACPNYQAGWMDNTSWKSSWGYTKSGTQFCGTIRHDEFKA